MPALCFENPVFRSILPPALFVDRYAAIEVDISRPFVRWQELVRPFKDFSRLISRVVLVVRGFHDPKYSAVVEFVRLFSECRLVRRVDENGRFYMAKRRQQLDQFRTDNHILVDPIPYTKHDLHIDEEQMMCFVEMVAGLGRHARDASVHLDALRRKVFDGAFDESVPHLDGMSRALMQRAIGAGWGRGD